MRAAQAPLHFHDPERKLHLKARTYILKKNQKSPWLNIHVRMHANLTPLIISYYIFLERKERLNFCSVINL